ncbi:hypothetical protein JKP75_10660 [Blastococcus sp. TML/M2B]|uniref:hypothetical protein n=1 Tax=Blastococcus sp. TML/M2B TaxID=2798727 RepID=UPI00190BBCC2|nr:hypothetical protein [Blastococcus sp. TML/M2B]
MTDSRSVVIGVKRTVPSSVSRRVRGRPPASMVTASGAAPACRSVGTTRSESMVRGSGKVSTRVGRTSSPAASQAVVGSPSTAAAALARGSVTGSLVASTVTVPRTEVSSSSSARPGRAVAVPKTWYSVQSVTKKVRSSQTASSEPVTSGAAHSGAPSPPVTQPGRPRSASKA